jgi:hypothetical protein
MIGRPIRVLPAKTIQDKTFKIKTPVLDVPVNYFIEFKHYTGNEIIYTLKDYKKLKPGEISSALLELGKRKGLPEDFDWNSHPCIKGLIGHLDENIPRYTCRVLTSLAVGLNRLKISNEEIWDKLATHIIRTVTSIQPKGLAYCFVAFLGRNKKDFLRDLVEVLPVHLPFMDSSDVMNIFSGLVKENIETEVLSKDIFPFILSKLSIFSVSQLQSILKLCENQKNSQKDLISQIQTSINSKLLKHKKVSFGGNDPQGLI